MGNQHYIGGVGYAACTAKNDTMLLSRMNIGLSLDGVP